MPQLHIGRDLEELWSDAVAPSSRPHFGRDLEEELCSGAVALSPPIGNALVTRSLGVLLLLIIVLAALDHVYAVGP